MIARLLARRQKLTAPNRVGCARPDSGPLFRELVESLLAEGHEVDFTARGRSMTPYINDGEKVRIRPLASRPRRGDVVLCRGAAGRLLLHRVVHRTGAAVITRGDAAQREDCPVPHSQVLGRAVAVSGRRRLHLFFPFGLALRLRKLPVLRSLAGPSFRSAAHRLLRFG
jgi:hypothetical protein